MKKKDKKYREKHRLLSNFHDNAVGWHKKDTFLNIKDTILNFTLVKNRHIMELSKFKGGKDHET